MPYENHSSGNDLEIGATNLIRFQHEQNQAKHEGGHVMCCPRFTAGEIFSSPTGVTQWTHRKLMQQAGTVLSTGQ